MKNKNFIITCSFIFFSLISITISAQSVINFDTARFIDAPEGETTNDAIKRLIIANKGAVIEFNSFEYDLGGKVLNIPRNITLKGTINNNTIDLTKHGSYLERHCILLQVF